MIAIAYLDQNENGFTDSEPWIDKWNGNWRKRVTELIQTGYKNVTPFHIDDDLESYTWEYISKHKITNSQKFDFKREDNELVRIKEEYTKYFGCNAVFMVQIELTHVIADRWIRSD